MDEEGKETIRWNIFDAWPVRIEYGNLNAKENNIQIETLELTHEKFERVVK
jgi:phage tail-like protein